MLDTGAELTCLDAKLIQQLGLHLSGSVALNMPAHGGFAFASPYDAGVTILHPSGNPWECLEVLDVTVLELPLASLGYQALIGRDILAQIRFLYNGPRNVFRLTY